MSGSLATGSGLQSLDSARFGDVWAQALRRTPSALQYGVSFLLVAAVTGLGFGLERLIAPANLTLVFVLPVVIAATTFGWGPSLVAAAAGVLSFDYFFTEPYFQFTIASPVDFSAAILLLVIAAIVSLVASQSRRRALLAERAARQAGALQAIAHGVIEGRPYREILRAAATALSQIFGGPAVVFQERDGGVEMVAEAGGATITLADEEAAIGVIALQLPSRARAYPFEESHFDLWPLRLPHGGALVLGVDFSKAEDGRPVTPQRLIEVVGAYLAAAGRTS